MTAHALALASQLSAPRINDFVHERGAITADTALRLARFFGTSAEFWIGLQTDHDMAVTHGALTCVLERIERSKNKKALLP